MEEKEVQTAARELGRNILSLANRPNPEKIRDAGATNDLTKVRSTQAHSGL
jgi:hypothetical protein